MVGNISITDVYMSVLSSLSVDEKPDLIAKLTNSIRNTYTKEQNIETEDPFACYEGDWGGNMSAEEYADDLRKPKFEGLPFLYPTVAKIIKQLFRVQKPP